MSVFSYWKQSKSSTRAYINGIYSEADDIGGGKAEMPKRNKKFWAGEQAIEKRKQFLL